MTPEEALDLITDVEISHSQDGDGNDIDVVTRTFNFEKLAWVISTFYEYINTH